MSVCFKNTIRPKKKKKRERAVSIYYTFIVIVHVCAVSKENHPQDSVNNIAF